MLLKKIFQPIHQIIRSSLFTPLASYSSKSNVHYIPRRAVLYVPGSDKRKIAKIPSLEADCVVLDCEDGVALSQKVAARETITHTLQSSFSSFEGKDCSVRVNSVSSGLCHDDLTAVLAGINLPQTLHLPKVENIEELNWFADKVSSCLPNPRKLIEPLRLIIFCESGNSLINLPTLCKHGIALSKNSPLVLDGVVFGSDDFCADIGITRSNEARELLYARQHFVMVVKSHQLQAIDLVYIDYKDLDGLEKQSREGATFGFTGKQVIHPGQVPIVQKAFSPSHERVEWATELIDCFKKHQMDGKGAFTFRGNMIDMPLVLQAKNIIQLSKSMRT